MIAATDDSALFYADTYNVVENGELIDRWCDPGDAKVNYLVNNMGTAAFELPANLYITYTTPPEDPTLRRSLDEYPNMLGNFVCDPF